MAEVTKNSAGPRRSEGTGVSSLFSAQRDEKGIELGRRLYAIATIFCFVFFLIYNMFSHGVHSPFMTWLFLWPLLLGFAPTTVLALVHNLPGPGEVSAFLYNAGVAALTVSSCLRGIFQIAGTSSVYQVYLMIFGAAVTAAGAILYALGAIADKVRS